MNPTVEKTKIEGLRTFTTLKADATPDDKGYSKLQVLAAGQWIDSWKGNLEITQADLFEFVANYKQGLGLPNKGLEGAPLDYSHADWDKASGWVMDLYVEGDILYASVEWTPAAKQAIADKEFKFFSPSLYPACLGMYSDPEDPTNTGRNVFMGGGLTNIPFFKGLTGLKASRLPQGAEDNTIYVSENFKKGNEMDFDTTRAKNPSELTADERTFLTENKDKLTAAELIAFSIGDKPAEKPTEKIEAAEKTDEQKAAESLQASIKAGTHVVVPAAEFSALKASVDGFMAENAEYKKTQIEASVKVEASKGKIKSDQIDEWTKRIVADATMLDVLKSLPENKVLASVFGTDTDGDVDANVTFKQKVDELMKADTSLSYSDAVVKAANENSQLANDREAALKA